MAEITLSLYNLKKYVDDNMYVHPSTHSATMIVQDSFHRFVTDTEKSTWNAKAETSLVSSVNKGLMSPVDKTKLDSISSNAEVNQDAFAAVLVGGTFLMADTKSDVLEIAAGQNISILPDQAHDRLTISLSGDVPKANDSNLLQGKDATHFATADHVHSSSTIPVGITKDTDAPNLWPTEGITQYLAGPNQIKDQPSVYGMITHHSAAGVRYQVWVEWTHPSGGPSGKMYHRNAGENDSVWGTWDRVANFSEIPTTLPANGGNSATVGGLPATAFILKDGDSPTGPLNLTQAPLKWLAGTDHATISMNNYGNDKDWLTVKFGDDPTQDRIKFSWSGTDGNYDVLDIVSNEIKSYKDITVNGHKVVVVGDDGKIAETMLPDRALQGDGGVPIGSIIPWTSTVIPNGWLECNGQFLSRIDFTELFDKITDTYNAGDGSTTFGIPDLRGEFIRGWDHGRGVDQDRVFGKFQADELRSHAHNVGESGDDSGSDGKYIDSIGTNNSKQPTNTTLVLPTGGVETRPRNVALVYIIKAKNVVGTDPTVRDLNAGLLGGLPASAFSLATHIIHPGENSLIAPNGWKKFADGLIFQWGYTPVYSVNRNEVKTINFPVTFPTACFSVMASSYNNQAGGANSGALVAGWDNSSVKLMNDFLGSVEPQAGTSIYYFAIGY